MSAMSACLYVPSRCLSLSTVVPIGVEPQFPPALFALLPVPFLGRAKPTVCCHKPSIWSSLAQSRAIRGKNARQRMVDPVRSTVHCGAMIDRHPPRVSPVADDGALQKAAEPAADALRCHPFYHGKIQILPKCPVRGPADFSIWYTPGVAAPCSAIEKEPQLVWEHTNKGNSVAVISDGTRVLGLGDIGPEAGLPVMEGKALLFKYLGGVDAVPICLDTKDPDEIVRTVTILQPSFGAVNLEDISQPKCFRILEQLRSRMRIPVWHDDQQGTATVLMAGLVNALKIVEKDLRRVRIALVGFGAANVSVYRLLRTAGVDPGAVIACDSTGVLHPGRGDIEEHQDRFPEKWQACRESNADRITGGIREALRGADVCIAFSRPGPGIIEPAWIADMANAPVVFACANPAPEIWPWDAKDAGATVVATGRSDFPNQLNNSLGFPGIFRGVLDVRASTITDSMAMAAAYGLSGFAETVGLGPDHILPTMSEWEVYPHVAAATAMEAQRAGVAAVEIGAAELLEKARALISSAREETELLYREGLIKPPPAA